MDELKLGKGNHNPGVGGSSPSSATNNSYKVINLNFENKDDFLFFHQGL